MILPNTSATIAHAMEQIPIIGQLVEVVTFRDYEYDSARNKADIDVSEIKPNEELETLPPRKRLQKSSPRISFGL